MDNSDEWSSPRPMGFALIGGGVVLTGAAALSGSDPAGLVIMGVAGLMLVVVGLASLLVRPRLAAAPGVLTIRTVVGRRSYPSAQIQRLRVVRYPRFGRQVPNLEIDVADEHGDDRLVILGRWELGAHPLEVADRLAELGFPVTADTDIRLRRGPRHD